MTPRFDVPIELRKKLANKRLIFTVTTGRSGTKYLSELLGLLPEVASYHEPHPKFMEVLRQAQTDNKIAYQFWLDKKIPTIAAETKGIYIETSHLACEGFLEPLIDIGLVPDLIILTRPFREVATSLYQLSTIPGRTEKGLRFYLSPGDPDVLPLPNWCNLHDYQLCFWYCLEIERRQKLYKQMVEDRNARVANLSLYELLKFKGFKKLFRKLDLPSPSLNGYLSYRGLKNLKINSKKEKKRLRALSEKRMEELEQEVDYLIRNK